jgi:hypothetical protein
MNFYFLCSAEKYNELRFHDVHDWQKWMTSGTSIANLWKPVELEYIYGAKSKKDKLFDISQCCDPLFTISKKALHLLGDMLRRNGDVLDIANPEGFCFFHCTNIVDALIEEESNVIWLDRAKGWVASINKFALDKEKVAGQEIFRLPHANYRYTFFGETFKNLVVKNNLKGVGFDRFETIIVR